MGDIALPLTALTMMRVQMAEGGERLGYVWGNGHHGVAHPDKVWRNQGLGACSDKMAPGSHSPFITVMAFRDLRFTTYINLLPLPVTPTM